MGLTLKHAHRFVLGGKIKFKLEFAFTNDVKFFSTKLNEFYIISGYNYVKKRKQ